MNPNAKNFETEIQAQFEEEKQFHIEPKRSISIEKAIV